MLDTEALISIAMHLAVGLASLFAFATLTRSAFVQNIFFGDSANAAATNTRRDRRRRANSKGNSETPGTIYGLVNTGNTCFLNSVLQALSSSTYLYQYLMSSPIITQRLDSIELALDIDEFPVTYALYQTISALNVVVDSPKAAYPTEVVNSLSDKMRITTYEQQDAQEFFQILSDAINEEENIVVQQGRSNSLLDADVLRGLVGERLRREPGRLGGWPSVLAQGGAPNGRRDPLHGLLASRLSCVQCGYTAAIRHFAFNNISLSLPFRASCTLEECLLSYITIESLQDVVCRKCSLVATLAKAEAKCPSTSKPGKSRRKAKKAPKQTQSQIVQHIKQALEYDIEGELGPSITLERVVSHHCTKQVMFAKPPPVLCLHLNRSAYFPNGAISKNPCRVKFPEILDLAPFCTTGHLVLGPQSPLSSPEPDPSRLLYRLQAVIVHYGSHSYGHFVTFRRKPHQTKDSFFNSSPSEWFQVSDQSVLAADRLDVLSSNPYMLLYEAIPTLPAVDPIDQPVAHEDFPIEGNQSPSPSTSSPGPPTPAEVSPDGEFISGTPHPAFASSLPSSSIHTFETRGELGLVD
ncbi:ubiquitin-specific protease ubp1 [Entomophthora muscae]|uniref:Ubiquitin-specific protease ubp1 n=1 Tax=Entomophthora muscae TaxID=34485 RepID=A0ACC2TMD4_9FUNG|nr:ubiquitin-specific protease ubp1 [Entomophthora muscae]